MGEVYEAEDLHLGRRVALKFISEDRTRSPQAIHRFEREARAASALNHPHICTVHDIAQDGGERFIVMELLEGETLRERLRGGALPIEDVIDFGVQTADALDAAHQAGIVHRDITPANIFVTSSRTVKLLDFGLAKLVPEGTRGRAIAAELPTETADEDVLTTPGAMAGTVAYMSPEQVRGDAIDHRSDLFSLGVVLYEMSTGRRPFAGKTSALVFDAILHSAPAPPPANTMPVALAQTLEKALEKHPRLRYQSASEIRLDLERLRAHREAPLPAFGARSRLSRWPAVALAAAIVAGSVGVASVLVRRQAGARPPAAVPRQLTSGAGVETEPAIAPDGSMIAFTSDESGNQDIWLVHVSGGPPQQLTDHPANDWHPSWFPDGSAIVFASDRGGRAAIWRAPRLDGSAATLLVPDADAPAVSPDGTHIAFLRVVSKPYSRVLVAPTADPSRARVLTGDRDGLWDHLDPAWSPDGKMICYAAWDGLWIVSAEDGQPRRLTNQRYDEQPAWSADGRFVYFTSYLETAATLWRVPASGGTRERVTLGGGVEREPFVSRDGRLLAFSTEDDNRDLHRMDLVTRREQQFGSSGREDFPAFAPDGRTVFFVSDRWGTADIWAQDLSNDGSPGPPRRVLEQDGTKSQPDCSPDGRWLAYYRVDGNRRDVWVVPTGGSGTPVRITEDPAGAIHPTWSPDGTKIAFVSNRGGNQHIWVQPVRDGMRVGNPVRLTSQGRRYTFPVWSPDGAQIAFVTGGPTGTTEAALIRSNGSGPVDLITSGASAVRVRWARASGLLLVAGLWGGTRYEIRMFDREGHRVDVEPVAIGADHIAGLFDISPDGRFVITARGKPEGDVWVMQSQSRPF